MRAAWYERQGPARAVLVVGEMATPEPGPGEVRIRVAASGINPGDVKKRLDAFGVGMRYPRVVPHADGAGVIDAVGDGVAAARRGERVWCHGAQTGRPVGTAAEHVVVPAAQAIALPDGVAFEQGACLGIPGLTAHRALDVAGPLTDRVVLVQGGGGAVGQCAVALAVAAGARVVATVRSARDRAVAERAGAAHAIDTRGVDADEVVARIAAVAPDGVDHVVEVAFDANVAVDERVLRQGGSIAAYASASAAPAIPFWPLLFKNARLFLLGSDDFPAEAKAAATRAVNAALGAGWPGFAIDARFPLEQIAAAHERVESGRAAGRVVLVLGDTA